MYNVPEKKKLNFGNQTMENQSNLNVKVKEARLLSSETSSSSLMRQNPLSPAHRGRLTSFCFAVRALKFTVKRTHKQQTEDNNAV